MRIAVVSRWNATCGVSMHAELIVPEFIRLGHEVKVFAPYVESANLWWHHRIIRNSEEDFVVRCYHELKPGSYEGGSFEEEKLLSYDPDFVIVESYTSIPYADIERLMRKLDCVKIAVIHEGRRRDIRYSNLRCFDTLVVFDERFIREVVGEFSDITRVIPYPCHPAVRSSRKFAEDVLTFLSFGRQPEEEYEPYFKALDRFEEKYDFVYRVIRSDGLLNFSRRWLKQERRRLTNEDVYTFLHSGDIHLIPKANIDAVVVSSTAFQCLGALIPTVAPATRHFELLDCVVKFNDVDDLVAKLERLIEDEDFRREIVKRAEKYVEENRCDKIAKKFIELYEELSLRKHQR